jgi:peptide/nickel transport system substrate-binding protein
MRTLVRLILFAILAGGLLSCSGFGSSPLELRYGFPSEPLKFDPLDPSNTADGRGILFNVFEGLVKPNPDGTMMPCIAEDWIIEQDGLIYDFILRDNMFFHDGSALTSADVKFSLETAKAAGFPGLNGIKDVSAADDKRITVTLNSADIEFLPYMTIGIVKAENNEREKRIIGTGPFFVDKYKRQRYLVLKKFDKYWQKLLPNPHDIPHLEKVTIVFYKNYDAQLTALRGGSIDGARLTGSMASQLDKEKFDFISSSSAAVQLLALNNDSITLNDIRVRQALNYGIDVQNIIDAAFFGMGTPSGSPIIPGLSAFYEDPKIYRYNPERAKALLEQAGYDGNRQKLPLEITVPSNYAMHIDTAQVIVNQLEIIGVEASIKLVDWPTWLGDVYFGRQFQATVISLDSQIVSPRGFLARYHSGADNNFINFSSKEFDSVYEAALAEPNESIRIGLYKEAQREIVKGAASVYLQDINYYFAIKANTYAGILDYPIYGEDFSSIYVIEKD